MKPNWERIREEWETSKITFKALAEKHGVKEGTLKSRRSREKWSRDATKKKDATISKKMQPKQKRKEQANRSGNPNPSHRFPKHNRFSEKHGFFSKNIPKETLEIMSMLDEANPADLIWDQIQIQYAAIIRSQHIMYVENKDDIVKVLKKEKGSDFGEEKEWEFQFAWDRQATFLNAQSRAISELRTSIRQFVDMTNEDDERRLKLEQMQSNIDKVKAETENLTGTGGSNAVDDWVAAMSDIDE